MEPDIPWWVVFAGCMVLVLLLCILMTHERDADKTDFTKGDFQKLIEDGNYQLRELKTAVSRLPQHELYDDGTTYAELPEHTRVVTSPDGTMRLAFLIRLSAADEESLGDTVAFRESDTLIVRHGDG